MCYYLNKAKSEDNIEFEFLKNTSELFLKLSSMNTVDPNNPFKLVNNLTFRVVFVCQRLLELGKANSEIEETLALELSKFPKIVFSLQEDLSTKIVSSYTKACFRIFSEGFAKIRNPAHFSQFLRNLIEFAKIVPKSAEFNFSALVVDPTIQDMVRQIIGIGKLNYTRKDSNDNELAIADTVSSIQIKDRLNYYRIAQNFLQLENSLREVNNPSSNQAIIDSQSNASSNDQNKLYEKIEDMDPKEMTKYISEKLTKIL